MLFSYGQFRGHTYRYFMKKKANLEFRGHHGPYFPKNDKEISLLAKIRYCMDAKN